MVKESGPKRTGSQETKAVPGQQAQADSGSPGEGSSLFWVNEQGEQCFGTSCFSIRVKPGIGRDGGEIRVVVDRNECNADVQALVDTLFGEVVKGVPTLYEAKSKVVK